MFINRMGKKCGIFITMQYTQQWEWRKQNCMKKYGSHQHNIGQNNPDTKKNKFYKAVKSQKVVIWVGGWVTGSRDEGGF